MKIENRVWINPDDGRLYVARPWLEPFLLDQYLNQAGLADLLVEHVGWHVQYDQSGFWHSGPIDICVGFEDLGPLE